MSRDTKRCWLALVAPAALIPVVGAAVVAAPSASAASPDAGTFTVVINDAVLVGASINGGEDVDSAPDGGVAPTARMEVRSQSGQLELYAPGPPGKTIRILADVTGETIVLDVTFACLDTVSVSDLRLLEGLLDAPINEALDVDPEVGFQGNFGTALANINALTPIPTLVDTVRADVGQLTAESITLNDASVEVIDQQFTKSQTCGEDPEAASPEEAAEVLEGNDILSEQTTDDFLDTFGVDGTAPADGETPPADDPLAVEPPADGLLGDLLGGAETESSDATTEPVQPGATPTTQNEGAPAPQPAAPAPGTSTANPPAPQPAPAPAPARPNDPIEDFFNLFR